jgi:serine O-acetyltransferase
MNVRALVNLLGADFRRHPAALKNPGFWAVAVYRYGNWAGELPPGIARSLASKVYGVLFLGVGVASGSVLNREARIGRDFRLVSGNTKIHPRAVIGDRVTMMYDVTLGQSRDGVPRIGNDVFIGAGVKILGPVTIGDGARVHPNSLVLGDVPPGATAAGVPARVLSHGGATATASETGTHEPAPRGADRTS